jgi:hypothetical protein
LEPIPEGNQSLIIMKANKDHILIMSSLLLVQ